jgi:hypothetical protein
MISGSDPTFIFGTWAFHPLLDPAILLFVLAWVGTATTLALRNGDMERPSRVAQLYGYTVCLIALVTILFTLPNLIETLFRLSDPLQADSQFGPTLSSLDAYKATYDHEPFPRDGGATPAARPSDEDLRRQYEALRADRIAENTFEGRRSLVSQLLLLGLAFGLFYGHWHWLRRQRLEAAATTP